MSIQLSTILNQSNAKQLCKAWVNFNGTLSTPITPRSAYNVTNITKNGTGDYTVNFASPLNDANYSVAFSTGGTNAPTSMRVVDDVTPRTTSAFRVQTYNTSTATNVDVNQVNIQVFGN
jgi:hypothetical protein